LKIPSDQGCSSEQVSNIVKSYPDVCNSDIRELILQQLRKEYQTQFSSGALNTEFLKSHINHIVGPSSACNNMNNLLLNRILTFEESKALQNHNDISNNRNIGPVNTSQIEPEITIVEQGHDVVLNDDTDFFEVNESNHYEDSSADLKPVHHKTSATDEDIIELDNKYNDVPTPCDEDDDDMNPHKIESDQEFCLENQSFAPQIPLLGGLPHSSYLHRLEDLSENDQFHPDITTYKLGGGMTITSNRQSSQNMHHTSSSATGMNDDSPSNLNFNVRKPLPTLRKINSFKNGNIVDSDGGDNLKRKYPFDLDNDAYELSTNADSSQIADGILKKNILETRLHREELEHSLKIKLLKKQIECSTLQSYFWSHKLKLLEH